MENATAADSSQSNISRILHLKRQKQRRIATRHLRIQSKTAIHRNESTCQIEQN